MQYAICYVSTVAPNLPISVIQDLLEQSSKKNNKKGITGILLFSNGNFFQVLEGEKNAVEDLFNTIKEDKKHYDLLPVFKKEISNPEFKEYKSDFLSLDTTYQENDLDLYISQIERLNPSIQNSVKYILNRFS